jgi:hypothetical protein
MKQENWMVSVMNDQLIIANSSFDTLSMVSIEEQKS